MGIGASPAAVRYVWQRHGLVVRYQRLLWLERKTAALGGVLRIHPREPSTTPFDLSLRFKFNHAYNMFAEYIIYVLF